MQNTIIVTGVIGMGVLGMNLGVGIVTMYESITSYPPPYTMQLKALAWDGENVGQNIIVSSKQPIPARWTAQITRDGGELCAGSGRFNYPPRDGSKFVWLNPSKWTGDTCPKIQAGDVATAVWEYNNVNGFKERTSGRLVIGETKEKL